MTKISGCPGSEQSGSTANLPPRTSSSLAASAKAFPSGDPVTPAAQITVREGINSSRPFTDTFAPCSETSSTRTPERHKTLSSINWRSAALANFSENAERMRGLASRIKIRASSGSKLRKSSFKESFAISPSAPASSTPVGPPPTMRKVSSARRLSGSLSFSASSNALSSRALSFVASSIFFSDGAICDHLSLPK